ncbi:MAG: hypothetical protein MRY64_00550 [Hyphomonadaceae bacterium]|nr:hypothetical protein [Hyphomonadaceae bacterium]
METAINVTRLGLDPYLGWGAFYALCAVMALVWLTYLINRGQAPLSRLLAILLGLAALSNPSIVEEERDPLPSVAAVILDRSESMAFGTRQDAAEAAYQAVTAQLGADPSLELRVLESDPKADGTNLYTALQGMMADVSRDRVAGAIMITDGQLHDLPANPGEAGDLGPVHGLIVGNQDRGDRRVEIVEGPSFGIVGENAEFIIRADDPDGGEIPVDVSVNGGETRTVFLIAGRDTPLTLEIERRGENVIVLETPPGREELTLANNRTAASLSGVRDRLRVLLITGRPNAAGRVWRDLLKSDPQVDLVHFTILRPPLKTDVTPIEELALINFPTEELFEGKLGEFNLIIFDQYERRGVITQSYLANMARYVEDGGALIIIAGEPFASPASLARTPLAAVLPAVPNGEIDVEHFVPALTDAGRRHTVTSPLDGQSWGGWMRAVGARAEVGDVLMTGPDGGPLLVLDRVGDGRVGLLLSDQIWLWARGHEGGGPFSELIRRMVHWMMKEPELEERQLSLIASGDIATIRLRTLSDSAPDLTLETPEGEIIALNWTAQAPGLFEASTSIEQLGLYRAEAGGLEAVALNGPANPKEYADLQSSDRVLAPIAEATRGGVFRIDADGGSLPEIRRVGRNGSAAGGSWLGLRERGAYVVRASSSTPLLPGIAAAAALIIFLLVAWRREGR